MARIETIKFSPHRAILVSPENLQWHAVSTRQLIDALPQIFWTDGTPWRVANMWLLERLSSHEVKQLTTVSNATNLLTYAQWLELTATDWRNFPENRTERCLLRYRGFLISQRDQGILAPSTVATRMRTAIAFYRWADEKNLVQNEFPMWKDRTTSITLTDTRGFQRSISVQGTDISIRNRPASRTTLEDGLLPLTAEDRDACLTFAKLYAPQELFLMLLLGFFTGMRLGTITGLRIQTLHNATVDPACKGLFRLAVGANASPPVPTKFDVNGFICVSKELLEELMRYAYSVKRLMRETLAEPADKDLLFLTARGHAYARRGSNKSAAINVAVHKLRRQAKHNGPEALKDFKFHQSRCTFATELARSALKEFGPLEAIALVRDALLHRNEQSSLGYIKFVQNAKIKAALANEYSRVFMGFNATRGTKND